MMNDVIKTEIESPLIALAERTDLDPIKLEKLLDLHERHLAKQQESDFLKAMAKFQGSCPTIIRRKKVEFGKTKYDYAPLDEIIETIRPHLTANELSYFFDTESDLVTLTVKVTICHSSGFQKTFTYKSEAIHDDGRMNGSQRRKSALTYSKRACIENALGLVTAGEDDDAMRAKDKMISEDQLENINILIKNTETKEKDFLKFLKVEELSELSFFEAKKALVALKQKRAL